MLENPGEQIFDVIRYFGIAQEDLQRALPQHRRRVPQFPETFIDNGDVDMLKAMRVYKEVGYDGMMMPDHVPRIEGAASEQGFAFAFGYIKALIAAVSAEGAKRCHAWLAASHTVAIGSGDSVTGSAGRTICSRAENT